MSTASSPALTQVLTIPSSPPATPTISAEEERLVRRIHKQLGGQARLRAITNPTAVRVTVLDALARDQPTPAAADAVRQNTLTTLQRRAVRTVTNRGAAVRSRIRQRNALGLLKDQLAKKDQQLTALREAYAAMQGILGVVTTQISPPPFAASPSCQLGPCAGPVGRVVTPNISTPVQHHIRPDVNMDLDEQSEPESDVEVASFNKSDIAFHGNVCHTKEPAAAKQTIALTSVASQPIIDLLFSSTRTPVQEQTPLCYLPMSPVTPRRTAPPTCMTAPPLDLSSALDLSSPFSSPDASASVLIADSFDLSVPDYTWNACSDDEEEKIDNADTGGDPSIDFCSFLGISGL
jgi:hypothetical protein